MENSAHTIPHSPAASLPPRSKAPVFVVGSPRSGTTLLYHMLLSAGNFAVYRAESQVFHMLEPRFGDLSIEANKRRLLQSWFDSRLFTATGLKAEQIENKIIEKCTNAGDFLRIVMEEMARHQGVERWAECTPDHLLYLSRIKNTIPNALVIHIIRDGRDVALSMEKQGYPRRLPWDHSKLRMAAGVYWEWMVETGCAMGRNLGSDYIEVRYENLIGKPREVLSELSAFIGQKLDYDEIQRVGIGSVSRPNTSFQTESVNDSFNPVGRWKGLYSSQELVKFESLTAVTLKNLNYAVESEKILRPPGLVAFRSQYRAFFNAKVFVRTKTPLAKWMVTRDLSRM